MESDVSGLEPEGVNVVWSWLVAWAWSGEVVADLSRVEALLPVAARAAPAALTATTRQVDLQVRGDETLLQARWTLTSTGPVARTWRVMGGGVLGAQVWVNGEPATVFDGGILWLTFDGRADVELRGSLTPDGNLWLAPATLGRWRVTAPDDEVVLTHDGRTVPQVDGTWFAPWGDMAVTRSPRATDQRSGRVQLDVQTGFTVVDGGLDAVSRVGIVPRGGSVQEVVLTVPQAADLALTLSAKGSWKRSGTRVHITLDAPTREPFTASATWSVTGKDLASASLEGVGLATPGSVARTTVLATNTDLEVVPNWSGGADLVEAALTAAQRGLVQGTVVSARTGHGPSTADLFRWTPTSMPALVVDVADWSAAISREGRALMQGNLTLRNDRAAALTVTLPAGHALVSVEVAGQQALAAKVGNAWRIPLPRSVESVDGLISFPVLLVVLGDTHRPWSRDGLTTYEQPMPILDAPVAVRRVTAYLPRGATSLAMPGEGGMVSAFSEGDTLAYGFGVGVDEARADAIWQEALSAYMVNDVAGAREKVDALKDLGASHSNVERLEANLDVIEGTVDTRNAEAQRIVSQSRARTQQARVVNAPDAPLPSVAEAKMERGSNDAYAAGKAASAVESSTTRFDDGTEHAPEDAYLLGGPGRRAEADVSLEPTETEVEDVLATGERATKPPKEVFRQLNEESTQRSPARVTSRVRRGGRRAAREAAYDPENGVVVDIRLSDRSSGGVDSSPAPTSGEEVEATRETLAGGDDPVEAGRRDNRKTAPALTADVMQKVPTGRSYGEAIRIAGGAELAGDASDENTFRVDGATATDPVAGTTLSFKARDVAALRLAEPPSEQDRADASPLTVVATRAGVVIPPLGQAIRHQHLLLAAGDDVPTVYQAVMRGRIR